jgi:hypothetical protein
MKNTLIAACFFLFMSGFSACTSMSRGAQYSKTAGEHDFEYFFPSSDFSRSFSTIEEAYDYVGAASIKFARTSSKASPTGLAARLSGPDIARDAPVFLVCYIRASNANSAVDLSGKDKPMENAVRGSVSATLVFLVFYNGRAVSISDFRLAQGWRYSDGNSQIKRFSDGDNTWNAEYPAGWGIDKAFAYLKGEIN